MKKHKNNTPEIVSGNSDKPLPEKKTSTLRQKINTAGSLVKKGASAGVSVLNGLFGDTLSENKLPLAIRMKFYRRNSPIELTRENLKINYPELNPKICILVHGLSTKESIWNFPDTPDINYGTLLQKDLNYTPFYVRYNTGLHISENGKELAQLTENLVNVYPVRIKEIIFISHSMGGLVARSACHYAKENNLKWVGNVKKMIFLGTPHLGAPLEKFSNFASGVLKILPFPYTNFSRKILNLRSSGIKDLRFGYVTDKDWKGNDPDSVLLNNKQNIPLLKGAEHFVITGTLTKNPDHPVSQWFGDSLVRKPSAQGKSKNEKLNLYFPEENHKEFPGINHLRLAHTEKIYEQIEKWCS